MIEHAKTHPPPPKSRSQKRYEFDTLQVGESLIFPADVAASFQSIRSAASQHGIRHNKRFSCGRLDDGRLQVYRDVDPVRFSAGSSVGTVEPIAPVVNDAPTRDQWRTHLLTFAENQSQFITSKYESCFGIMTQWTKQLAEETGKFYAAVYVRKTNELQLTLLPSGKAVTPLFFKDEPLSDTSELIVSTEDVVMEAHG